MLTISEEVLLLVLDYDTGRLNAEAAEPLRAHRYRRRRVDGTLADQDRVDTDLSRFFVVNSDPLREPVLDRALVRIVHDGESRPAEHWIGVFADDYQALQSLLIDRLARKTHQGGSKRLLPMA